MKYQVTVYSNVSTHSRLKAAGHELPVYQQLMLGFNTQPPEGGWLEEAVRDVTTPRFNTQPPEGGWIEGKNYV